ncbi:MAG: hypothetical protein ACD_34C00506G0001 [uncultured bacterium]|nr:MAG: hypothetical protein ACD_34C00506G0001 [uncultured bacterium]
MTFAVIVHKPYPDPAAGTVPPINEIVVPKIETVPPLQVVEAFAGLAKVTPEGNVLEIAEGIVDNVNGKLFGLVMVMVKTEVPPEPIVVGVKKLFTCAWKETSCAFTIGICG